MVPTTYSVAANNANLTCTAVGIIDKTLQIGMFHRTTNEYVLSMYIFAYLRYRPTYNVKCTLVGNKIVHHSYVVRASPTGAAQIHRSQLDTWLQRIGQIQLQDETRNI